jgi:hypothetical protein
MQSTPVYLPAQSRDLTSFITSRALATQAILKERTKEKRPSFADGAFRFDLRLDRLTGLVAL